jgi:signal transduction histidine kinase/ActR/RegA family two-component response regulator
MNITDKIAGFTLTDSDLDPFEQHLLRETQAVKVHQSHYVLPLVIIVAIVYIVSLWDDAPRFRLVLWESLIVAAACFRAVICNRIEKKLAQADLSELHSNELWLFNTSLLSTFIIGSGFWWICINGTDRAVFAVTMLCCLYAIGTTINSSVRFHNFPVLLLANLGQGIMFLSGLGRSADPEISAALISITLILIQFGHKNSAIFAESIRTREEIREKNLKLGEANEDKSHFLAAASHDISQPLQVVKVCLDLLMEKPTDSKTRETIENANEATQMLVTQCESLKDISNLDRGKVKAHKTRTRLDRLLERIFRSTHTAATDKGLKFELHTEPINIYTDKLRLEESIRNIVLNAIRYTEKGSVSISTSEDSNGVHVLVADTGIGIARGEHEKIFNVFYQTDNPARNPGEGRGYGLAIVKKNAALLDIEVTLESDLGAGTTFDLYIPRSEQVTDLPDKTGIPVKSVVAEHGIHGLNILIVDDNPLVLKTLSGLIRDWNCSPILAASAEEAMAIIENENRIDFAIIDDMLGKNESGLELAKYLSTRIFNRPIIVTGNALSERQLEIERHGFEVFTKPMEAAALQQIIATKSESSGKTATTGN